jgi:hypothetical protein
MTVNAVVWHDFLFFLIPYHIFYRFLSQYFPIFFRFGLPDIIELYTLVGCPDKLASN